MHRLTQRGLIRCHSDPPLLWASSCDKELTATLHSEQYSSFLALSSSVSGVDGLLEAEAPVAPGAGAPDPGCSEPTALPLPQLGEEEEDGGMRGGVWVGRSGHTEGTGESMGGVGGVVRGGRGPGASSGPFNCDRGRGSSAKPKRKTKAGLLNKCQMQCRENIKELFMQSKKVQNRTIKCFTVDFIVFKPCG